MDFKKKMTTTEDVVIMDGAVVCGNVKIGKGSSVWFNAVIRGDADEIVIGEDTNIQECTVMHVDEGFPIHVGDCVTVGHGCILHGCTIGDNTVVGMGSTVLNGARIGKNCILGAGSLATGKTDIPDGWMAFGNPAKAVRPLREEEIADNHESGIDYRKERELYR